MQDITYSVYAFRITGSQKNKIIWPETLQTRDNLVVLVVENLGGTKTTYVIEFFRGSSCNDLVPYLLITVSFVLVNSNGKPTYTRSILNSIPTH